jgi:hypothetical protein
MLYLISSLSPFHVHLAYPTLHYLTCASSRTANAKDYNTTHQGCARHNSFHTQHFPHSTASMPAIGTLLPCSPLSARSTPAHDARDWPLIWVLVTVGIILLLELVLVVALLRVRHLRSEARWRRLRDRGVVIVSGAALLWTKDLPLRPYISYLNLRQIVDQQKRDQVSEVV